MLGKTAIHLRMMTERDIPKVLVVPRIHVEQVSKHKGDLTIKLERGTRMETKERRGFGSCNSRIQKTWAGCCAAFSIIRPDWMLEVAFDKASPWIQIENLQVAKVSDGTLDMNAILNYKLKCRHQAF